MLLHVSFHSFSVQAAITFILKLSPQLITYGTCRLGSLSLQGKAIVLKFESSFTYALKIQVLEKVV